MVSLRFDVCLKMFNIVRISRFPTEFLNKNTSKILHTVAQRNVLQGRALSSHTKPKSSDEDSVADKPKKKKPFVLKVTLINTNNSITVMALEEAEKLSKRRNLKLIKVADPDSNSPRPTYKLIEESEYLKEEKKILDKKPGTNKELLKSEKLVSITSKINDNDLAYRISNIKKLLKKMHVVVIVINKLDNEATSMKIYQTIKSKVKENGKESMKSINKTVIKFYIEPLMNQQESDSSTNEEDSNEESTKPTT